jgi:hypothetical protein
MIPIGAFLRAAFRFLAVAGFLFVFFDVFFVADFFLAMRLLVIVGADPRHLGDLRDTEFPFRVVPVAEGFAAVVVRAGVDPVGVSDVRESRGARARLSLLLRLGLLGRDDLE